MDPKPEICSSAVASRNGSFNLPFSHHSHIAKAIDHLRAKGGTCFLLGSCLPMPFFLLSPTAGGRQTQTDRLMGWGEKGEKELSVGLLKHTCLWSRHRPMFLPFNLRWKKRAITNDLLLTTDRRHLSREQQIGPHRKMKTWHQTQRAK